MDYMKNQDRWDRQEKMLDFIEQWQESGNIYLTLSITVFSVHLENLRVNYMATTFEAFSAFRHRLKTIQQHSNGDDSLLTKVIYKKFPRQQEENEPDFI
jgi:hypothetical protein